MTATEIVLIIIGAVICALGFVLPNKKKNPEEDPTGFSEEVVRKMVDKEVEGAKAQIADVVDETITYAMEKSERSMERVANEKIMAVNEYSDTVLEEINKNHKEVLFLYDMLNDKQDNLKEAVSEAEKAAKEVQQSVKDVQEAKASEFKPIAPPKATVIYKPAEPVEPVVQFDNVPSKAEVLEAQEEKEPSYGDIVAAEIARAEAERSAFVAKSMDDDPERENIYADTYDDADDWVDEPVKKKSKSTKKVTVKGLDESENNEKASKVDLHFAGGRDSGRNNNERILELHRSGKSNMAIAKELGLGIGEVKLVIDLFKGM